MQSSKPFNLTTLVVWFKIAIYMIENQTFYFPPSSFFPPSICPATGNYSLHGGCVNPAGCGKSPLRNSWSRVTNSCAKKAGAKTLSHCADCNQHMQYTGRANERRMGKKKRRRSNATQQSGWLVVPLGTDALNQYSRVTRVARSERLEAGQRKRERTTVLARI